MPQQLNVKTNRLLIPGGMFLKKPLLHMALMATVTVSLSVYATAASARNCPGTESRLVQCFDFRGNPVADIFCSRVGVKPITTRACVADCPDPDPPDRDDPETESAPEPEPEPEPSDPLVFDLDGNGISLVGFEDGVMFDMDNDGNPDQTGWIDSADGLLALDENGNGVIDDQSELFGTSDTGSYMHLAELDHNSDGMIDTNDAVWNQLSMWVDSNSNGTTDAGELKTMSDLGMQSIDLNYNTVNEVNAGNAVTGVGTFTQIVEGVGQVVNQVIETFFSFVSGDSE